MQFSWFFSGHNQTTFDKCFIQKFDHLQFYPPHVYKQLHTHAYRPIMIQELLQYSNTILWLQIDQRFQSQNSFKNFIANHTSKSGISLWTKDNNVPTSSLTHPKMYHYLVKEKKSIENFNFQHMIELSAMLVTNDSDISAKVMKPWILCALIQDCIEPIGAQSTGCRFDKKPKYRYSGKVIVHLGNCTLCNKHIPLTYIFQDVMTMTYQLSILSWV